MTYLIEVEHDASFVSYHCKSCNSMNEALRTRELLIK